MQDLYVVGLAADLGGKHLLGASVARYSNRLDESALGVEAMLSLRQAELVLRRWISGDEAQEDRGDAVVRPARLVDHVGENITRAIEAAERAEGFRPPRGKPLPVFGRAVLVLCRLGALEWDLAAISLLPGHDGLRILESLPLEQVPIVGKDSVHARSDRVERGLSVGIRGDPGEDCLRIRVHHAEATVVIPINRPNLHVPLLNMARVEVLVQLLTLDAVLGHPIEDRCEQLVLGIFETLDSATWIEARGEAPVEPLGQYCALSHFPAAFQPSRIYELVPQAGRRDVAWLSLVASGTLLLFAPLGSIPSAATSS